MMNELESSSWISTALVGSRMFRVSVGLTSIFMDSQSQLKDGVAEVSNNLM